MVCLLFHNIDFLVGASQYEMYACMYNKCAIELKTTNNDTSIINSSVIIASRSCLDMDFTQFITNNGYPSDFMIMGKSNIKIAWIGNIEDSRMFIGDVLSLCWLDKAAVKNDSIKRSNYSIDVGKLLIMGWCSIFCK